MSKMIFLPDDHPPPRPLGPTWSRGGTLSASSVELGMPNGQPSQLANLRPKWEPGEQPKPSVRYVERMMEKGHKLSPRAIAIVGRIMEDTEVHGELVPLHLRLRAAEYIVDKTWPKAPAGASLTIDGATSLEVHFNFPGGETKLLNDHAETVTMSFDADGE